MNATTYLAVVAAVSAAGHAVALAAPAVDPEQLYRAYAAVSGAYPAALLAGFVLYWLLPPAGGAEVVAPRLRRVGYVVLVLGIVYLAFWADGFGNVYLNDGRWQLGGKLGTRPAEPARAVRVMWDVFRLYTAVPLVLAGGALVYRVATRPEGIAPDAGT